MKILTLESQIDILLSSVFQSEIAPQHTLDCVDRLLSIFKQAGSVRPDTHSFGSLFIGDECFDV